ncbi:MAG: 2-oxoacid:acceptor oxidoreductase family protein [Elusimicrobiota bacterium]
MLEIRFHGRGGQGTVLAAKMLASAVLKSGRGECLALPEFGVERRGAPVRAFARIAKEPIYVRSRVYNPDVVVVMDPVLIEDPAVVHGLKSGGAIVVNSEQSEAELSKRWPGFQVRAVAARHIALKHGLGTRTSPVVNTVMIGVLCAALELADMDSLDAAIRESVPVKIDENLAAAREGYASFREGGTHAAS